MWTSKIVQVENKIVRLGFKKPHLYTNPKRNVY